MNDRVLDRTDGVTASFVKELLRKAALLAADGGRSGVDDSDVNAALDELLDSASAMTRVLLGVARDDDPAPGPVPPAASGRGWGRVERRG
jgi:hypothetical protein